MIALSTNSLPKGASNPDESSQGQVITRLIAGGWKSSDILLQQVIATERNNLRPDLLLLYNLYPLAALEHIHGSNQKAVAEEQVFRYAENTDLPFTLVADGSATVLYNNSTLDMHPIDGLTPQDLWGALGRSWDLNDPRLFPAALVGMDTDRPRFHHARAVSRILDHVDNGQKAILLTMAAGTGRGEVMLQVLWKLVQSGRCKRALVLSETREILSDIKQRLQANGLQDVVLLGHGKQLEQARIHLAQRNTLDQESSPWAWQKIAPDSYDLVIVGKVHKMELMPPILAHFSGALQLSIVFPNSRLPDEVRHSYGRPIQSVSLLDVAPSAIGNPPPGFRSLRLGQIAEIKPGLSNVRKSLLLETNAEPGIAIVTGKDLGPEGVLDLTQLEALDRRLLGDASAVCEQLALKPDDILMTSYWSSPDAIKVALVPPVISGCTVFANRLLRIRITDPAVRAQDVFDFLQSDFWLLQLRTLASGSTTLDRISARDVSQLPVFLPEKQNNQRKPVRVSVAGQALEQIRRDIIPLLERAHGVDKHDEDVPELRLVVDKLRTLVSGLVAPTLEERVLTKYPMPIALAYRRFLDARFNVYEQVLRLRDIFEATSFFVYNAVLADSFRRLDMTKYHVKENAIRRAHDNFSLSTRLSFVGAVLELAQTAGSRDDLFMPELAGTNFVSAAKMLQEHFRNRISHTAAVSESQQKLLLDEFRPVVDSVLEELSFLERYRLVRVPLLYHKRGQLVRRMELYCGSVPSLSEEPLSAAELVPADHDHIVLLNLDDEVLDLYPMCQLLANTVTRHETHLCFLKQRKPRDKQLQGESVQGAFEVQLAGYDDFDSLQARLAAGPANQIMNS
jgi:hypothetical protein